MYFQMNVWVTILIDVSARYKEWTVDVKDSGGLWMRKLRLVFRWDYFPLQTLMEGTTRVAARVIVWLVLWLQFPSSEAIKNKRDLLRSAHLQHNIQEMTMQTLRKNMQMRDTLLHV